MKKNRIEDFKNLIEEIEKQFTPIEDWYPLEVQIEILYDCTLRCAMCYNGVRANEKKFDDYIRECNFAEMDEEKRCNVNKVVELCLRKGCKFFTITGGEPLLSPEVVYELIAKIKSHGGYVSINTNATLIDDTVAASLKEAGLNSALVSIHGPEELTHRKTVCVNDAFEKTINGIYSLIKHGIHVVPNFVASHVNVEKMEETAEMLYNMGIKRQAYSIFIPTPGVEEHERLKMDEDDYRIYFMAIDTLNKKYPDINATATLPVPPCLSKGIVGSENMRTFEHRTCPSGRQFMVVNADGNASPCIQYAWNPTYGSNIYNEKMLNKLNVWKKLFNTPEKCFTCGFKGRCNPCNMNILRENNEVLSPLSVPYPNHVNLTNEEAVPFNKKFEIEVKCEITELVKIYKLREGVIFREEKENYLTIINPFIQGYTVLKNITKVALSGNFRFSSSADYRLFKAMNIIEEVVNAKEYLTLIAFELAPKYKILTEFIGHDFNNENVVYCMRTDTAGRYFCLANTSSERKTYEEAKVLYTKYLDLIKKDVSS